MDISSEKKIKWSGIFSIVGGIFIHLMIGNLYLWGNISPSVISYFHYLDCENTINNNSHMILPLSFSIMSLINPFGAALYKQLNVKILLFIGSIICIGSIYLAS